MNTLSRDLRKLLEKKVLEARTIAEAGGHKALEEYAPTPGSKIYADDDELLTEFQAERRIFVPLRDIPRSLRDAVIAIEDSRFYSH